MVKNSALTLPVLVILVLVGAGVVFLGPQLTGYIPSIVSIVNPSIHYLI